MEGLRQGLCKFSGPTRTALVFAMAPGDELRVVNGFSGSIRQLPEDEAVANPAFDVTPARLVSAIVTERGQVAPDALRSLYPEA